MRYIILGHSNPDVDSILSGILLEKVLNKKYNTDEYKFIIPEEHIDTTSGNIIKELGIDLDKYKDNHVDKEDLLILVDHHEEDRYSNKIISIYDHHPPTSDFIKPSIYYNTSSCSTTVIIYRLFEEYIDKDDFILNRYLSYKYDCGKHEYTNETYEYYDYEWINNRIGFDSKENRYNTLFRQYSYHSVWITNNMENYNHYIFLRKEYNKDSDIDMVYIYFDKRTNSGNKKKFKHICLFFWHFIKLKL